MSLRNGELSDERPNVIVLTVESLRHDMVALETTPQLLKAAKEGYSFSEHRAVSAWTGANIISILTGFSPFIAGVHSRDYSLPADHDAPLALLNERGYRVEGLQGFMAMDIYRNMGLDIVLQLDEPLYWLAERQKEGVPFFLWYHYLHTHLPYSTVREYPTPATLKLASGTLPADQQKRLELVRDRSAIRYDATRFTPQDVELIHQLQHSTIQEFDHWFGRFWEFFTKSGLWENTILVLTADHGDEHGERTMVGHGSTTQLAHLHEEIVRVPLFIWLPKNLKDRVTDETTHYRTTHIDLIPTIFHLLGIDIPHEGRDLFAERRHSPWLAMTSSGGFAEEDPTHIRYFEYGLLADSFKLLLREENSGKVTTRLYDLALDPSEANDISASSPDKVRSLLQQLAPAIAHRTILKPLQDEIRKDEGSGPQWLYPKKSGTYSYNDLNDGFKLQWAGTDTERYLLEYVAGRGENQLHGRLEVQGTLKDFGAISRRYWQTWVVANSPFRLRVKQLQGSSWSDWLELVAVP